MSEMNVKQLSEEEIDQVVGGDEGGGVTVDWSGAGGGGDDEWEPRLVCPKCHGDVKDVLLQSIGSDGKRMHRFDCRKCGRHWWKRQLVDYGQVK